MTTATDWTGRVGRTWAAEWQRTDRSFANLSPHLDAAIRSAAPAGPFHAIDIGCGAGATSLALAHARPDATVTGLDLSADLIRTARARAGDRGTVTFHHGDASRWPRNFHPPTSSSRATASCSSPIPSPPSPRSAPRPAPAPASSSPASAIAATMSGRPI
nr:class I SAM-dependent methyltransferase [Sphingomonas melonis]